MCYPVLIFYLIHYFAAVSVDVIFISIYHTNMYILSCLKKDQRGKSPFRVDS